MSILSMELADDPGGLGYQAAIDEGDHQAVADLLNAERFDSEYAQPISSAQLILWAGANGALDRIDEAQSYSDESSEQARATSSSLRSAAKAAMRMIDRPDTSLDLSDPHIEDMLDAFRQAGVLSAGDISQLVALTTRPISRATQLDLNFITHQDVTEALDVPGA